jgi:uncharacterized membrane protein YhhN
MVQRPDVVQGNGLAVASLVLGIVGAIFGLIPILFVVAWICGLLALVFGISGFRKGRQGAPHKGMALAGLILGIVALALGGWGVAIVSDAFNQLDQSLP